MQFLSRFKNLSFLRFLIVGAVCFFVNLGVLYFVTDICGFHYLIAMVVSIIIANGIGFLLNRSFTFAAQATDFWRELKRYYTVNMGGFALNLLLMAIFVSGFKVPYLLASAFLGITFALINFIFHSKWSFAPREVGPANQIK